MRIGLCLNMVASSPGGTGIERIARLAPLGFDYAELPLAETTALSAREFAEHRARVRDSGVSCETFNNFFPPSIRLTGREARRDDALRYAEGALDRAAEMGAEVVVFGSGGAKNVPEGFPLEEGFAQVVSLLQDLSPMASGRGIIIAIEPLRKAECNLINTFEEGCALARATGRDNVRVLVDYYHMCVEGEPLLHLRRDGLEFLRHVHFANPNGRVFPKGSSEYAYAPFAAALRDIGYRGRVSCEAYCEGDFESQAAAAARVMRSIFE